MELPKEEAQSRSKTAKNNIIISFFIKGISIAISLLLVPLTLNYLSSELYGIWLTISSIMIWLNFFDIGFTLGLKNKLAEAVAKKDFHKGKKLVSTTYAILIIIFIPLCIILEPLIPCVEWTKFLNISSIYQSQLVSVVHILLLCICFQMILGVISSVLAAFQMVAMSTIFPVISNILSLGVIFVLIKYTEPSLFNLAMSISFLPILVLFIGSIYFFKTKFKFVAPSFKEIDFSYAKDLFQLGAKFFLIQIQIVVLFQTTNLLILNLSSAQDVTSYNIAFKYMSIISMAFTIILSPLWPAFTDAYIKKDFKWMTNTYKRMTRIYIYMIGVVVLMVILSPYVYSIWISNKAVISITMTISVAIYILINSWDSLQTYLLNGIGTIKLQTYITLIGLFCHIPLSFFLGRYLHLGAYGVVISMSIITGIYSIFFTMQIHKILSHRGKGIWIK